MAHICVGDLAIIGSDNGLSPGRREAIICTNAGMLLIGLLAANVSEIIIESHTFSFMKVYLEMSPEKPFCLRSSVLTMYVGWITKSQVPTVAYPYLE